MTYNDNEIIKALECCINGKCKGCPLYAMNCSPKVAMAFSVDFINRQKAEIERLENDLEEMADRLGVLLWHATDGKLSKSNYTTEVMVCALNDYISECCREAEAEAIKEFAEYILSLFPSDEYVTTISRFSVKYKAKEMERERE